MMMIDGAARQRVECRRLRHPWMACGENARIRERWDGFKRCPRIMEQRAAKGRSGEIDQQYSTAPRHDAAVHLVGDAAVGVGHRVEQREILLLDVSRCGASISRGKWYLPIASTSFHPRGFRLAEVRGDDLDVRGARASPVGPIPRTSSTPSENPSLMRTHQHHTVMGKLVKALEEGKLLRLLDHNHAPCL